MPVIPNAFRNRLLCFIAGGLLLANGPAVAEPPVWKTGTAFRRQLSENVGLTWQDRGLRDGLDRLSQIYGVAIFLDRRIDPGQIITLSTQDVPLEGLLSQIAASVGAETAIIGSVVYVGPRETASSLTSLADSRRRDIARLPNDAKTRLLRSDVWQWEEVAQPRELLRDLAREAGASVVHHELVPLDLWPADSFPPLSMVDRLTLLLAGFGLTFEIDDRGTVIRLIAASTAAAVAKAPAAAQSTTVAKPSKAKGEKLYSLTVANEPAGNVLSTVAKALGKELTYQPQLVDKLKQSVTFNLKDATLEHLLETTLKPLGLSYRITDKQLEITVAE